LHEAAENRALGPARGGEEGPPLWGRIRGAPGGPPRPVGGRRAGNPPQPPVGGVGELLLPGAGQPGLSSDRSARVPSAASVVVCQAQGTGPRDRTLPGRTPVPGAGSSPTQRADVHLLVGEGMSPCPRAGWGKPACPVR